MTTRVLSGIARLDEVLGGGLWRDSINLIIGLPGSGKTILAQRYAHENGTVERPSLYISTVSEPFDKILRFGQTLSFFDLAAVGTRVLYEDVGEELSSDGLPATVAKIEQLSMQYQPGVVVIDSFKAFAEFASDPREYRSFLHRLAGHLTAAHGTTLMLGEYQRDEIHTAAEFAVADSVIHLGSRATADRVSRFLEVLKLRGSDYSSGRHGFRLSEDGLAIFPRLADASDGSDYSLSGERLSTGIESLDRLVGGGYWPGASTLIAGPSGVGKTLVGLHFIAAGAARNEPCLIASLQENPAQLDRVAKGFSWDLGEVRMLYRSPVDLYLDEWIHNLLDEVERSGIKRVLIDSLSDLQHAEPDEVRFREYIYSLVQRFSRSGVSLVMTTEVPDLFTTTSLSEFGISHLADNVLLLQYVRDGSKLRRALTVLKARATMIEPEVSEFTIDQRGIVIAGTIDSRPGVRRDLA